MPIALACSACASHLSKTSPMPAAASLCCCSGVGHSPALAHEAPMGPHMRWPTVPGLAYCMGILLMVRPAAGSRTLLVTSGAPAPAPAADSAPAPQSASASLAAPVSGPPAAAPEVAAGAAHPNAGTPRLFGCTCKLGAEGSLHSSPSGDMLACDAAWLGKHDCYNIVVHTGRVIA